MIWVVLIVAIIVRLININQSLWWDEGITAWVVQNGDFWNIFWGFIKSDFHPPLHYILLNLWGRLFGFSEISLRLPSVIFGVATVYITYLIGKKSYSQKVGIIAAVLLSIAPLHLYYSQEARMYSLTAFSVALSWYFFLRLINGQKFAIILFALSNILIFYSDYIALFVIPAQFIFLIIFYRLKIKQFATATLVSLLPILVWLPVLKEQLSFGINSTNSLPVWKSTIGGVGLKEVLMLPVKMLVGRISFDNKLVYALFVSFTGFVYAIATISVFVKRFGKKQILFLLWLVFPPVTAFILSYQIPIFSYFRFIFLLPAFYLLLGAGLNNLKSILFKVMFTLIIVIELIFSAMYLFNAKYHREDWKDAVKLINLHKSEQTIVLHKNLMIPQVFRYYQLADVNTKPAFKKIPVSSQADLNDLEINLQNFTQIYLFDYLVDFTDPGRILESKLTELGFGLVSEENFTGVGIIKLYTKDKE